MSLPIYIDIDGTLTDNGEGAGGKPLLRRIEAVKKMIRANKEVVIWSGNGTEYAKKFCRLNALNPRHIIGKPLHCYDDNPEIRPGGLSVLRATDLDAG